MLHGKKPAGIYGLSLDPQEKVLVKIIVKFPSDVMHGDYHIPIMQLSDGRHVGGLDFIARIVKEVVK